MVKKWILRDHHIVFYSLQKYLLKESYMCFEALVSHHIRTHMKWHRCVAPTSQVCTCTLLLVTEKNKEYAVCVAFISMKISGIAEVVRDGRHNMHHHLISPLTLLWRGLWDKKIFTAIGECVIIVTRGLFPSDGPGIIDKGACFICHWNHILHTKDDSSCLTPLTFISLVLMCFCVCSLHNYFEAISICIAKPPVLVTLGSTGCEHQLRRCSGRHLMSR
jgi:hypothetical protein